MDMYFWTAAFQVIKWWMVYGWWLWAADLEVSWWNWPPGSAISPIWSSPWMSRRRRRCESHKAPDSRRFVRFMDLALSFTKGDQHDVCVYNTTTCMIVSFAIWCAVKFSFCPCCTVQVSKRLAAPGELKKEPSRRYRGAVEDGRCA